mmetsp:Transcript_22841/g.31951  ORF Transcript_22841/g.31951 Transcript_22841/m.31951 type:complete len:263 (-) Transcript_22841:702-1490(-)
MLDSTPISLALVGLEILGKPIHHLVDGLVQAILFDNTTFITTPCLIFVPGEPTNSMESISSKDITSVKSTVVIDQQDITGFHSKSGNVLFGSSLNFLTIFQTQGLHVIGVKDFCHTHLGDTTGPSVTKFSCVVVSIVEPHRKTGDWVTVDGGFSSFDSLETSGLSVSFVNHFKVHVKLGCNSSIHNTLDSLLDNTRKSGRDVQVGNRDADLTVVQLLQDLGIHFSKNGSTISYEETSTTLGSLLETNECSIGSSTFGSRFAV